jgi:iron complex outermembrane receptor protein
MKKSMLSLSFALFSLCSFAQTQGKVTGIIKDGGDKKVIIAATVSLLKAKDSSLVKVAVTDSAGNFSFENVKEGSYIVSASSTGHLKVYSNSFALNSAENSKELGVLQLKEDNKTLSAVTVTAKKPFIERKLDRTIINVESSITSAGNTAMEVLEKSPGVAVDKDGNISLKGKQGVVILIDGKQTYMSGQDLANYLQSMPASNLDQIELMPNPSAKYDASGNSGVINIKTKKNRQKGFNGSVNSTYGRGKYGRNYNSLNLNYRNGKFNVFSNIGVNRAKYQQILSIHREFLDNNKNAEAIFDQEAKFLRNRPNNNMKLGADFYASKKTTIGVVFSGYINSGSQKGGNTSYLKDGSGIVDSVMNATNEDKEPCKNGSVNLNFRHTFDSTGRELTADIDVLKYKSNRKQNFVTDNYSQDWIKKSSEQLISDLPSTINVYSAKIDYVHPFKNGVKMESGVKASFVNTDNFAGYFNVLGGMPIVDNEKTNHFKYKENINAGYVNLSKEFKKWSLQGGLRLENTNYSGNQFGNPIHADSSFKKSYTSLFPTMFAGYKLNEKNQFGFSYGRRISRPDYESLNPFIFFIDKYTYESGNPFLKPMYANVFELTHTYNKFLTTTFNYSHNKDMFNEYFDRSGYATVIKEQNYGSIDDISLSMSAEIKPAKWWTMMPYAELNYNAVNSMFDGYDVKTHGTGVSTNLNNQFRFSKGWGAEMSGFYRSSMKRGQFNISDNKQVSAGVSKQVLKNKGSLKLYINDIFNSGNQKGTVEIQNTIAQFTQKRDSRNVGINFNYRFGKPMKTQQRRSGGAGDEQNRVKGN